MTPESIAGIAERLGFPITVGIVLLVMLWFVLNQVFGRLGADVRAVIPKIDTAVGYFTTRLDTQSDQYARISEQQTRILQEISRQNVEAMHELNATLREQTNVLTRVHENLNTAMMLLAHTQSELNATKTAVVRTEEMVKEKAQEITRKIDSTANGGTEHADNRGTGSQDPPA